MIGPRLNRRIVGPKAARLGQIDGQKRRRAPYHHPRFTRKAPKRSLWLPRVPAVAGPERLSGSRLHQRARSGGAAAPSRELRPRPIKVCHMGTIFHDHHTCLIACRPRPPRDIPSGIGWNMRLQLNCLFMNAPW